MKKIEEYAFSFLGVCFMFVGCLVFLVRPFGDVSNTSVVGFGLLIGGLILMALQFIINLLVVLCTAAERIKEIMEGLRRNQPN